MCTQVAGIPNRLSVSTFGSHGEGTLDHADRDDPDTPYISNTLVYVTLI